MDFGHFYHKKDKDELDCGSGFFIGGGGEDGWICPRINY